ncbi:hypothetical protein J5N97_030243 [Dioscorea zingiberensis]|uniref:Uncharacterized protein n=1 Tax=Dioscorea zingiberensis TaxID=325984 RepID=A0A9D5H3V4_9LILI|nr:hypothetical protein J5N97_030243 [Dioscorea zingiberensis]
MVLQKRLDYGSCGYPVPVMPRVPKSARGKRSVRKKAEESQMCAFDLLAAVAGNLLLEAENFSTPNKSTETPCIASPEDTTAKSEERNTEKPVKAEPYDQGSCNKSTLVSEVSVQRPRSCQIKRQSYSPKATLSEHVPVFMKNEGFGKDGCSGHSIVDGHNRVSGGSPGLVSWKCSSEKIFPSSAESSEGNGDHQTKARVQIGKWKLGNLVDNNAHNHGTCNLEDPMELDVKPPVFISSDSSVEAPFYGDHNACGVASPKLRNAVVDRDDDENLSRNTHPSIMTYRAARLRRIGNRRIRKLLASRYWKATPTSKGGELCNSDAQSKLVRKMCYTSQRMQRSSFKQRKVFERCSSPAPKAVSKEGIFSLGKGAFKTKVSDSHTTSHGANGQSSSRIGQKSLCESEDFHVKFSIKSFKVPELLIEIPETATVGSLKRTVMETVTAFLEGGLHVGVLLQGKKVRDDNKTLLQAGISHGDKIDNLGFTLEPKLRQAPQILMGSEDPHFFLPSDAKEPKPLSRITAIIPPPTSDPRPFDATIEPPLTFVDPESDSIHSPTSESLQDKASNSRALVSIPAVDVEALAVVPLHKSKRAELVQRRIRRPFTISEVEALVQAVEKLGTGRWRDVKVRAFDNAKHRTYVDLKDKWKTLVHTAKISPHQRRGEPVPQELLDRVLSAHAYWSQQQAKLQVKPSPA